MFGSLLIANTVMNDCTFPAVDTNVHADDIAVCAELCDIAALEGKCDLYTFDSNVDLNCAFYVLDETVPEFQAKCGTIAFPVVNECVFYDETCEITDDCPACTACGTGTCGGYMDSQCEMTGEIIDYFYPIPSYDVCKRLCAKAPGANFMTWNRETEKCDCYDSGERECSMKIVAQVTDVAECSS